MTIASRGKPATPRPSTTKGIEWRSWPRRPRRLSHPMIGGNRMILTRALTAAALSVSLIPTGAIAAVHANREVAAFHAPDTRDCSFFQLVGVSEADPAVPGNPWFAVPKSHMGYK